MDRNLPNEFSFHVDVSVIKSHLFKLNSKKATGPDMLPAKLLKIGSIILCCHVCYLLNACISQGDFPEILKSNNMNIGNHRPVGVLHIVSKVFQKEIINHAIF